MTLFFFYDLFCIKSFIPVCSPWEQEVALRVGWEKEHLQPTPWGSVWMSPPRLRGCRPQWNKSVFVVNNATVILLAADRNCGIWKGGERLITSKKRKKKENLTNKKKHPCTWEVGTRERKQQLTLFLVLRGIRKCHCNREQNGRVGRDRWAQWEEGKEDNGELGGAGRTQ